MSHVVESVIVREKFKSKWIGDLAGETIWQRILYELIEHKKRSKMILISLLVPEKIAFKDSNVPLPNYFTYLFYLLFILLKYLIELNTNISSQP